MPLVNVFAELEQFVIGPRVANFLQSAITPVPEAEVPSELSKWHFALRLTTEFFPFSDKSHLMILRIDHLLIR